jgi:hypothetical protein
MLSPELMDKLAKGEALSGKDWTEIIKIQGKVIPTT